MNNKSPAMLGVAYKATSDNTWTLEFVKDLLTNTLYPFYLGFCGFSYKNIVPISTQAGLDDIAHEVLVPASRGVSANWNVLIQQGLATDAQYIGILNDDIAFPSPLDERCWLTYLINHLNTNPSIGIISPDWYWSQNNSLEEYKKSAKINRAVKDRPGIRGFCFLMRRAAVEDLIRVCGRVFDEDFQCQWEEVEMLVRLHRLGWESRILENIPTYHYASKTLNTTNPEWVARWYNKGKKLFHQKTGAPNTGNKGHINFEVQDGVFCYREDSNRPWVKFWK